MAAEVSPEEQVVLAPHRSLQPRAPVLGKGVEKVGGDFIHPGDMKGGWKPRHSFKGPAHIISHSQALTLAKGL